MQTRLKVRFAFFSPIWFRKKGICGWHLHSGRGSNPPDPLSFCKINLILKS